MPNAVGNGPSEPLDQPIDVQVMFDQHWDSMVRLAYLLVSDRESAQDIAQDAFTSFFTSRARPTSRQAALAYLRASVVNKSRSSLRRRLVARRHLVKLHADQHLDGSDAPLLHEAEMAQIAAAVARLPRRQREVIVLRYWNELSEIEIARTLGVSEGTVKAAAFRARQSIRSQLESQDD